jgi:hypothetical protein
MSVQVGFFCYATPVEAAAAACASFPPVSTMTPAGDLVLTTSCQGVNPDTGALQLQIASTPTNGTQSTYRTVEQLPAFPPCQHQEYLDAFSSIFWAFVTVIVVPYCLYKMYQRMLDFRNGQRGND